MNTNPLSEIARLSKLLDEACVLDLNAAIAPQLAKIKEMSKSLDLACGAVAASSFQELVNRIVPDPRPDLEKNIQVSADIFIHTVRTAVQSGKSCPDLWKDAGRECLDLLILLRQRDQLGRAPAEVKDYTKEIRDDNAVQRARDSEKKGGGE